MISLKKVALGTKIKIFGQKFKIKSENKFEYFSFGKLSGHNDFLNLSNFYNSTFLAFDPGSR